MSRRIVIVGGGIIGVSSAWYLRRAGYGVTVIDRAKIGAACSGGNCGLVCPSHVLPLTEPGAFKSALKAMVSPGSPFRIRPRVDPALWSWMWNFARRCNESSMIQSAHAIQAMLASAMVEYKELVSQSGIECEWQARGLLFTYRTKKELDAYESTNRLLEEHFDEPARKLSASETVDLEPAMREDVAGSWFYEHDAHLRPDKLIQSLQSRLANDGVRFIENCEFQGFEGQGFENSGENDAASVSLGGRAGKIKTPEGSLEADLFLFASGAWTPLLKEHLGCRVPIEPGKGYSITMPRPAVCPSIPIIFPEHRVAVTPMDSGYRLGSIMEFAGYDESIRPERLQLLRDGAKHYLREPFCEPELSTWFGWRPMTYDSVPVIDRSPRYDNVWIAAGHNMLGLSMAPSTGRLVTELIGGSEPHVDPHPYRLKRFG